VVGLYGRCGILTGMRNVADSSQPHLRFWYPLLVEVLLERCRRWYGTLQGIV
jgi:hypothetical protein